MTLTTLSTTNCEAFLMATKPRIKGGTTYRCPACGQTVTVLVRLSAPPTCSEHTGGGRKMEEV